MTGQGNFIAQYRYTLDRNGRRTKVSEEGEAGSRETSYTYDGAGRLAGEKTVSVDATGREAVTGYAYEYDSVGNRVSKTAETKDGSVETKYTYNSRNQLVTEETDGEETACSYDANGNLLNKSGASADETYRYDAYDRLISYVADHGAKKETYGYDAEGVRRSKTSLNGEKETNTVFVSDTSGELSRTLAETDETGNFLAVYTWGDTLLAQTREGKTSTYLYDGHGDVRGLLDGKGILTDTYSYNAYGELTEKTGETENHFLYTGEYYDGTSGLYYLRARYMNPETGTFISMDSYQGDMYEPVTLHKYLYANADPVTYTDPSGMFSLPECNLVSAIGAELYQSRFAIMGMAIMNGIGKSAMTAMSGGDLGEVSMALLEGIAEGSAMGMLFCAVAAITVTSMAAVFMSVVAADSIVSIVIAIRSVMDGDYMNALVYGAFAVVGIIGVCKWYKVNYQIDYVGDKGIARFAHYKPKKVFKSTDPLVGDVATQIEENYPGRVQAVNRKIFRSDGTVRTDLDIELDTIVIQVKTGGGNKLTKQLIASVEGTGKIAVGYVPDIKPSVYRQATSSGFKVLRNIEDLLDFISKN